MKLFFLLASFLFVSVSSVEAHSTKSIYPAPAFQDYSVDYGNHRYQTYNYDIPYVSHARYAPSQIRKVSSVTRSNNYVQNYSYQAPTYIQKSLPRYNGGTTHVLRRTNSYAPKKYEPTRPVYPRAQSTCSYGH